MLHISGIRRIPCLHTATAPRPNAEQGRNAAYDIFLSRYWFSAHITFTDGHYFASHFFDILAFTHISFSSHARYFAAFQVSLHLFSFAHWKSLSLSYIARLFAHAHVTKRSAPIYFIVMKHFIRVVSRYYSHTIRWFPHDRLSLTLLNWFHILLLLLSLSKITPYLLHISPYIDITLVSADSFLRWYKMLKNTATFQAYFHFDSVVFLWCYS